MPSSRPEPSSPRAASLGSTLGRAAQAILPRRHRSRKPAPDPHAARSPPSPQPAGRAVTTVLNACRQLDQDGLGIRRASSALHPSAFSPFLQLDHCGPHHLAPNADVHGDAPRCGQQVLSYVLSGEMEYRDSCGHHSALRDGALNLLTAGSGLAVSHILRGPVIEYFSIWINIPRERMTAHPEVRTTSTPPSVVTGKGESAARIRVLAGPPHPEALHNNSDDDSLKRSTSLYLETAAGRASVYDVRMQPKSQLVLNPETERVFVYVYRGSAIVGRRTKLREGDFAVLEENRNLPLVIDSCGVHTDAVDKTGQDFHDFDKFTENSCWCLVLSGDPVMEPVTVLSSGIVACTPRGIRKAFQEYTCRSYGSTSPLACSPLASKLKIMADFDEDSIDEVVSDIENADDDIDIPDIEFGKIE